MESQMDSKCLQDGDGNIAPVGTSALKTFWTVTKCSIGICMLTLPYGFRQTGFVVATSTLMFFFALASLCISRIINCQKYAKEVRGISDDTYIGVAEELLGKFGRWTAAVCITLNQLGTNVGYNIFICNTFAHYFPALDFLGWLLLLQILFVPLCSIRSLRWLSSVSLGGLICLWLGSVLAFLVMVKHGIDSGWKPQAAATNAAEFALFCGLSAFALEGMAATTLTIGRSMAEPEKLPTVVNASLLFILILELLFANLGNISFSGGNQTITKNFPPGALSTAVSVLFCLELVCTYPGNAVPVWKFLEGIVFDRGRPVLGARSPDLRDVYRDPRSESSRIRIKSVMMRTFFRTAVVAVLAMIAYIFRHSFAVFLSLIGSIACSAVMLLLPALMDLKLAERWSRAWFVDGFLLALGIFAPFAGIAGAFQHSNT